MSNLHFDVQIGDMLFPIWFWHCPMDIHLKVNEIIRRRVKIPTTCLIVTFIMNFRFSHYLK